MGKSTISMAIFNSYVSHNQRVMIERQPETHYAVDQKQLRFGSVSNGGCHPVGEQFTELYEFYGTLW